MENTEIKVHLEKINNINPTNKNNTSVNPNLISINSHGKNNNLPLVTIKENDNLNQQLSN